MVFKTSTGEISEWNEGDFKNLRLHQAQDIINQSVINPFGKFQFGSLTKWGYELRLDGINILFGEGMQKYSDDEYKKTIELKKAVEELIEKNVVCSTIKSNGRIGVSINKNNWKKIKEKIEEFEYEVKYLNDKHGLSTRNVGTKGMF